MVADTGAYVGHVSVYNTSFIIGFVVWVPLIPIHLLPLPITTHSGEGPLQIIEEVLPMRSNLGAAVIEGGLASGGGLTLEQIFSADASQTVPEGQGVTPHPFV